MMGNGKQGRTLYVPWNPTALTMASATSLMLTSSFSPTVMMGGVYEGQLPDRRRNE
jgi:hypothetical protein